MTAGVGSLTIPAGQQRRIRAYDTHGAVVSEGVVPLPQATPVQVPTIDNWDK